MEASVRIVLTYSQSYNWVNGSLNPNHGRLFAIHQEHTICVILKIYYVICVYVIG